MAERNDNELMRLPPQNVEAEQMMLGAILIDDQNVLPLVKARSEDFYRTGHGIIFSAMQELYQSGMNVDLVTLSDALRKKNLVEKAGGAAYLAELVSLVPTSANFRSHERLVVAAAQLRRVIHVCCAADQKAHNGGDPNEILSECITALNDIRRHEGDGIVSQRDVMKAGFDYVEWRYERRGKIAGLPSGFRDLDSCLDGFQPGDYVVIGGRPSMGKTALVEGLRDAAAEHLRGASGGCVGFLSLEMNKQQLALRAFSRATGIPLRRIRRGEIGERDWNPITTATAKLCDLPVKYDFTSNHERQVEATIDEMVQRHDARMLLIDYLQLMRPEREHRDGNREQEVARHSRLFKSKAKQHNIPILVLSQLNRGLESRPDKRPVLADLRESGALEQDADVIIFVYRDEVYNPCKCPPEYECGCGKRGRAELLVRKNRMGPTATVDLFWKKENTKFMNAGN